MHHEMDRTDDNQCVSLCVRPNTVMPPRNEAPVREDKQTPDPKSLRWVAVLHPCKPWRT